MCTAVLIGWDPATPSHPPALGLVLRGRYWSAKIDDISLWPPGGPCITASGDILYSRLQTKSVICLVVYFVQAWWGSRKCETLGKSNQRSGTRQVELCVPFYKQSLIITIEFFPASNSDNRFIKDDIVTKTWNCIKEILKGTVSWDRF